MEYRYISSEMNKGSQPIRPLVRLTDDIYRELAEKVRIEADISDDEYVYIEVEAERDQYSHILRMQAILAYDRELSPCGRTLAYLRKITPTWLYVHTFDAEGEEVINNCDLTQLKHYL